MKTMRTFLSVLLVCAWSVVTLAEEKKSDVPAKGEKGTVVGAIAKMQNGKITVKDGGKETVVMPYWRGRMPADGGGFDKEMMKKLEQFKVGDKVRIAWTMEEHRRIDSIEKVE